MAAALLHDQVDCIESSAPGARWFVWRTATDRAHAMRATLGDRPRISGSFRAVKIDRVDNLLTELGMRKPAKWMPASIDVPLAIIARIPIALDKVIGAQT